MTPKIIKCHSCQKNSPGESVGSFLLTAINQWAKVPMFAFRMCQECFEKLKGNVETDIVETMKPKIEIAQ